MEGPHAMWSLTMTGDTSSVRSANDEVVHLGGCW